MCASTGEEDPEKYPEDEKLGSFARGQEESEEMQEGTFGSTEEPDAD